MCSLTNRRLSHLENNISVVLCSPISASYTCRAPADEHVVWPDMRPVDIPEGGELPLVLPPAAYAFDFVLAHSTAEDEPELVTGLYCYAELVIQQVCVYMGAQYSNCMH
jgi:hypothetical protein